MNPPGGRALTARKSFTQRPCACANHAIRSLDTAGAANMSRQCAICQCVLFEGEEMFETAHGIVDLLCYRSLEILGRVWE